MDFYTYLSSSEMRVNPASKWVDRIEKESTWIQQGKLQREATHTMDKDRVSQRSDAYLFLL